MSEINWHKIQTKLEGKCYVCGGNLPDHIGVCPVFGEEIQNKWTAIDKQVKHISECVDDLLDSYKDVRRILHRQ